MKNQPCLLPVVVSIFVLLSNACKKKEEVKVEPIPARSSLLPQVITSEISSIGDTSAIGGGTVTYGGASPMKAVGIYWDTVPRPIDVPTYTDNGPVTGFYTSKLVGLKPNKKYYVVAFAANEAGISYGNEVSFTTRVGWAKVTASTLNGYSVSCMETQGTSIYLGTQNGVLFSPDTGNTWQHIGLAGKAISSISFNGGAVFAGCSPYVYRTTNNGSNWTQSTALPVANYQYTIYKLAFSGTNIFAVATFYAYRSTDNGDSWTRTINGLANIPGYLTGIVSSGPNVIVSTDMSHIYITNNNGNSWTESASLSMTGQQSFGLSLIGNKIYLQQNNSKGYYSADNGNTWTEATDFPVYPAALYASGPTVFVYGGFNGSNRLSISYDGGDTWSTISAMGLPFGYDPNIIVSGNYFFWSSADQGLYRRLRY